MKKNNTLEKDWKEIKRQPCEIYTRVMWYLRNVNNYNIWKKTEFYSRKYFVTGCNCNREFIEKYKPTTNSDTTLTIN